MSRRACCCIAGPGCDLTGLCIQVSFAGITLVDWFQHFADLGDPDCAEDPPTLYAAWGYNQTLRANLTTGNLESCSARIVVRAPLTALCSADPGSFRHAAGVVAQVNTTCLNDRLYLTGVSLVTRTTGCGGTLSGNAIELFSWAAIDPGDYVPIGPGAATVPNQHDTTPPSSPASDSEMIRGVGGSASVSVYDGTCASPPVYVVAVKCDDPTETIVVDPSTAPAGYYGIEYASEAYRLTGITTEESPVSVTWTEEVCPEPTEKLFKGVRCRSTGVAATAPAEVAYVPNPSIGVGNGTLTYTWSETWPGLGSCLSVRCSYTVRYRPTTDPATPGVPVVAHQAGTACAQSDITRCGEIGCPPGVIGDPWDPCDFPEPFRPPWCPDRSELMAMRAPEPVPSLPRRALRYARAVLSGREVDAETLALRQLSCFGDPARGVDPCPSLAGEPGRRYCNDCGCGARRNAILDPEPTTGRSKLQYVELTCPRRRPGFANAE